ncbi:olfactory receptor 1G1-like [Bombina bombina]|uniref:olfactory receptor 1G1-like n=1 Tax=Bombina bombina TaxID=8345 RepID=UPI00235A4E20|nr:olfactory receptor 1G1-like [Bombina bombina]
MYLLAVLGNLMITTAVCLVSQLHTPMYFFLCNLSVEDIVYVSTVLPKLLVTTVTENTSISITSCFAQMFFFALCVVVEFLLLTSMAYDRYVAICIPLHYILIMNKMVCILLAFTSWFIGAIISLILILMVTNLTFCDVQDINHFFCDFQTVIKISCSDTTNIIMFTSIAGVLVGCCPFILIITSYMYIIATILKIQTSDGRSKMFSSCSSHLTVVILFYGTSLSMNMKPKSENSQKLDIILSLLYIAVVPVLNPLVYSLRNREDKLEDIENRSRRHNLRIRGILESIAPDVLDAYLQRLFQHLKGPTFTPLIAMDRFHRALRPKPKEGQPPRDVIIHFCEYQDK